MSDRAETLVLRHSLTRREFTLEAALAILAGCVITISDTACGSSTSPTPTAATPVDVNGVIAANHGHSAVITGAQITAGSAVSLDIRGTATHTHTVALSQADLTALKIKQTVRPPRRPIRVTRTPSRSRRHKAGSPVIRNPQHTETPRKVHPRITRITRIGDERRVLRRTTAGNRRPSARSADCAAQAGRVRRAPSLCLCVSVVSSLCVFVCFVLSW